MLSKQVCKQCASSRGDNTVVDPSWTSTKDFAWDNHHEVYCGIMARRAGYFSYRDVRKTPPVFCPYRLEHVMETQKA